MNIEPPPQIYNVDIPFARSSSISKSFSLADMDRYSAVTLYRFDCRNERAPSREETVFCRETGRKDDSEPDEARNNGCIKVDMM